MRRVHKYDTTDIATIVVFVGLRAAPEEDGSTSRRCQPRERPCEGGHKVWRAGYAGVGCYRDQRPEGLRQGPAKIHELIAGFPIHLQCASARHQTVDGRLDLRAHLAQTITVCASEVDEDSGDDVIPYTRGPSVNVQCKEMQYLILCTGAIFQGEGAVGQRHRVRETWSPKTALRRMGVDPPSLSREIALGKRGCWHAHSHQTMPLVRLCVYAIWRPSPRGGRLALTRRLRVSQEDRRPPQCEIRVPTSDYALLPPESKAEHSDPQRPRRHWRSRCSVSVLQQ
ncbi:hypothetical protein TcG_10256 [Trypanosoma cruzi]|nr:hypothetical protein TcG_10256 [Trypanosoma cruzi]